MSRSSSSSSSSASSSTSSVFTDVRDDIVNFYSYKDLTDTLSEFMKHHDIVWMGPVGLCTLNGCVRYIIRLNTSTVNVQFISPIQQTFEWTYNHLISESSSTSPKCSYHVTLAKNVSDASVTFSANLCFFKEFVKTLKNYLYTICRFINGESMFEFWKYLNDNESVQTDDSYNSEEDSDYDKDDDKDSDSDE